MKAPKNEFAKIVFYLALGILLLTLPLYVKNPYILHILITAGTWVILTASLHLMMTTGLMTLGHAAFMGVGAYGSALLAMRLGWSFWVTLPLAGIISALLAVTVGSVFLRVKGLLLAVVTFAFGEAVVLTLKHWPGPPDGLTGIPVPDPISLPGGLVIEFVGKEPFYYLILIITVLSILILYGIEKSRLGRVFSYINENDALAESVGINVHLFRMISFAIACFFAGIAGSMYAHYHTYAAPMEFSVWASVLIFLFCVIGGTRSLLGPVIGAVVLTAVPELLRGAKIYQSLAYAILVLTVIFFIPEGLISIPDKIKGWLNKRKDGNLPLQDKTGGNT